MREDMADGAGKPLPARLDGSIEHGAGGFVIRLPGAGGRLHHAAQEPFGRAGPQENAVIGAQNHEGRAAAQFAGRPSSASSDRVPAAPRRAPGKASIQGQRAQAGRFGVQMVAPRSMTACAKSPGLSGGTRSRVSARIVGFAFGQRLLDDEEARHHPLHIAVHRRRRLIERDGGDCRRRIGADSRQGQQFGLGRREIRRRSRSTTALAQAWRLRARE